jgi:hypothetical protein
MDIRELRHAAHLSAIITAVLAAIGIAIAIWQIKASEASQREASARDAYKEYLKIIIDKPEIADLQIPSGQSLSARTAGQEALVSYFLYSAEQVFEAFPNDPAWHSAIEMDACEMSASLGSARARHLWQEHGSEFAGFIQQSLAKCSSAQEEQSE